MRAIALSGVVCVAACFAALTGGTVPARPAAESPAGAAVTETFAPGPATEAVAAGMAETGCVGVMAESPADVAESAAAGLATGIATDQNVVERAAESLVLAEAAASPAVMTRAGVPQAARADAASDAEKIRAILLELSSALQENNAARFLDQVDHRRCPDYAALEDNVVAMTAQDEVGSSVGVIEQIRKGDGYDLKLDWLLELKPLGGGAGVEQRHATVTCRIEPAGKHWKVTLLAPVSFFKPLQGSAR